MSDVDLIKEAETEARRAFRFYSRKVFWHLPIVTFMSSVSTLPYC